MIKRNLANVISLLGVLPVFLLFIDGGYRFILPLIVFNNIMDDLDGIVAGQLKARSPFGAVMDNVADVVAHSVFVYVVAVQFGWVATVLAVAAAAAMLIRSVSRIIPGATAGIGSPTNEMIRHMFFVLLLARAFEFDVAIVLSVVFGLHAVSMLVPFRMPGLIRSLAKSPLAVGLVNVALVVAWLVPDTAVAIAVAFASTYLFGFTVGSLAWLKARQAVASRP